MTDQYIRNQGTGEMEVYADPFRDITPDDVLAAQNVEAEIIYELQVAELSFIRLAKKLSDFKRNKTYLALGAENFDEWANSPRLKGMNSRTARNLVRIADELLPIFAARGELGVLPPISTMYDMLPMLNDENAEENIIEAAYKVQGLTTRDAKEVIREQRGLSRDDQPAYFKATILPSDGERVNINVTCSSPEGLYLVGKLSVYKKDWPRLEQIFKGYVDVAGGF